MPPKITLRPYQQQGIKKILEALQNNQKGFLLADEMELGKTVQALRVIHEKAKSFNINPRLFLILCPSFLKPKWVQEIKKFLPKNRNYSILLYSYSEISVNSIQRYLSAQKFILTVLDEVHYLIHFNSLRTQAVFGFPSARYKTIKDASKQLLGLSGTPIRNRMGELYPWLWATKHPMIQNKTEEKFIHIWAKSVRQTRMGLTHKGLKNADEFKKQLSGDGRFMLRRILSEVAPDLPKAQRIDIPIECSAEMYKEEQKLLRELLELAGYRANQLEALMQSPNFLNTLIASMPSFEKYTIVKRQQGLFKFKAISDYFLLSVLPMLEKFVVYTCHVDVAQKYQEFFKKQKRRTILITGQIEAEERLKLVQKADAEKECVLIATMKSIKEGYDLFNFSHAFFCELDWVPADLNQVERRFRIIQNPRPVFYNYFLFNKGMEQYVYKTLEEKIEVTESVFGKKQEKVNETKKNKSKAYRKTP